MKNTLLLLLILLGSFQLKAQGGDCVFKKPQITIHFGSGLVRELNTEMPNYRRVTSSCPTDGHYSYVSSTSDCFTGDWLTIPEDHTPGDVDGNMMLVNASPRSGTFLTTTINGLKGNTIYEFSVWMMNVCRISDKCPFPLLPNISIRLQTPDGKVVAQFGTGDLARGLSPQWTPYKALFTTPASESPLILVMTDNAPGGCGNDFALDDISFRECEKPKPVVTTAPGRQKIAKTEAKPPVVVKQQAKPPVVVKQQQKPPVVAKQQSPKPVLQKDTPTKRTLQTSQVRKQQTDSPTVSLSKQRPLPVAPPTALITRSNPVIKTIETEATEIKIDLYDNGQIDGDTVTIYHNNKLLVSRARLSEKAISFKVQVSPEQPHHELVMVAENLGSIPPNTSLMILTAGAKRYDVFISSTEQKNAKIVIDLK